MQERGKPQLEHGLKLQDLHKNLKNEGKMGVAHELDSLSWKWMGVMFKIKKAGSLQQQNKFTSGGG